MIDRSVAVAEGKDPNKPNVYAEIDETSNELVASVAGNSPGGEVNAGTELSLKTELPVTAEGVRRANAEDPNVEIQLTGNGK